MHARTHLQFRGPADTEGQKALRRNAEVDQRTGLQPQELAEAGSPACQLDGDRNRG